MARKIVVTSGKGGVGKTTVCANLGYSLANLDKKILLIDTDFGLNNLDVVMGVENKVVYDIFDVIEGKCRVSNALIQDFYNENLYILPTNRTFAKLPSVESIQSVMSEIEEMFDFILIDCPAGMDDGWLRSVMLASEAIVVTTPHISSVRDADKVVTKLNACNINLIGVVVNRARGDLMLDGEMVSVDAIAKFLDIPLYGVVPEDDYIAHQLIEASQLKNNCDSDKAYKMLARRLCFGDNQIFDCCRRYRGIIGGFRRKLKRVL